MTTFTLLKDKCRAGIKTRIKTRIKKDLPYSFSASPLYSGTPEGIRTPDLRIRSPLLYPAELQAHFAKENSNNMVCFFCPYQI